MKEDKRGGRKPAPVPTGHDQRAAARDHSVPHGNRKNDAVPPSKAHAPSAKADGAHVCRPRSIFFDAHVAEENDWAFFRRFGGETLRGFWIS